MMPALFASVLPCRIGQSIVLEQASKRSSPRSEYVLLGTDHLSLERVHPLYSRGYGMHILLLVGTYTCKHSHDPCSVSSQMSGVEETKISPLVPKAEISLPKGWLNIYLIYILSLRNND